MKTLASIIQHSKKKITVSVAYYEHSFIMNQAEGPNKYTPIAFVLNQGSLIWSLCIMNKIFGPKGVHNNDPDCSSINNVND